MDFGLDDVGVDGDDNDFFLASDSSIALVFALSRLRELLLLSWLCGPAPPEERPLRARWKAYGGGRASQVLHVIVCFDEILPRVWD